MQKPSTTRRPSVQSWDNVNPSGNRTSLPGRALRFREAVPDYVVLLTERTRLPLEPFENACFARWGDRWSTRLVSSMTPDEIQGYFAELAQKGHAGRELEREKNLMRWFYRWALRCGWTTVDPTQSLERTRTLPEHPTVTWTSVEQRRLLDACRGIFRLNESALDEDPSSDPRELGGAMRKPPIAPPYLYPLVLFGLRSGLRLGHLLNLEWRHVDLKTARISIPACEVKNGSPIEVVIDGDMRAAFTDLLRFAHKQPALPRRVFDGAGLPLWRDRPDEHAVLHVFRRVRKHAGIPEGDFNSLRLTFARNCACAGVPIAHPLNVGDWDDSKLVLEVYDQVEERVTCTREVTTVAPAVVEFVPCESSCECTVTDPSNEPGSKTEIIPIEGSI
jgi:integrase